MPIVIQLVDADEEGEPLFRGEAEVEFPDPRAIVSMSFHMSGVTFPGPGEYRFQLYAGGEFLMERRLVVIEIPETQT